MAPDAGSSSRSPRPNPDDSNRHRRDRTSFRVPRNSAVVPTVLRGAHVRQKRPAENRFAIEQIGVPEGVPLGHQRIFAGGTVHQHVEAAQFAFDAREQRFDFGFLGVIHANCESCAAGRSDFLGRRAASYASSGAVDRDAASPSARAMPRPAPRVAPATTATAPVMGVFKEAPKFLPP